MESLPEFLSFVCGIMMFVMSLLLFINAQLFYRRHYTSVSHAIDGTGLHLGLLISTQQMMMWGHYCIFSKRAKRDGVDHVFSNLALPVRRHLLFHWYGLNFGVLMLIVGYLLSPK